MGGSFMHYGRTLLPTWSLTGSSASDMMQEDAAADLESEGGASQQQQQQQQRSIDFKRWRASEKHPKGYRLATIDEVNSHRSELFRCEALQTWDISKLHDGWIDGPGYGNVSVKAFRPGMTTCILINEGEIELDEEGQRIAFLFACEVGLKAAEPFLKTFDKKIEADETSCSPLHAAILSKDFDLCCKLVQAGADVNKALGGRLARAFDAMAVPSKKFSSLTGATPLHLAIAFDFEKFVLDCLLSKSRDLNLQACDEANRTALHYAALSGNEAIFEALSGKIEMDHPDNTGVTVLHVAAAAENSTAILDILLKSKNVNFTLCERAGKSALHIAAASGNVGNIKALIPQMKRAIQQADSSGKIPLVYAVESFQPEVIRELLEEDGRPIKVMGEVGVGQSITQKTPLHYAVYLTKKKDQHSMLEPLLEYATFRTEEMFDLFWDENASLYRDAKRVKVRQLLAKYLTKCRSTPVTTDTTETSLQRAAKAGMMDLVRLLLAEQPERLQQLESESWKDTLEDEEKNHALDVIRICYIELMHKGDSSIIEDFRRQATDQPALEDSLGRRALVEGLATLLLNPYTGTPLTIGIYGEWGHGKSSLMRQVEAVLCTTAIQQAFIRPVKDKQITDNGKKVIDAVAKAVKELVGEAKIKKNVQPESKLVNAYSAEVILEYFVDNYDPQHHRLYKSLALTDASEWLKPMKHKADGESRTDNQSTDTVHQPRTAAVLTELFKRPKHTANGENSRNKQSTDTVRQPTTPSVLTVWYNAWQYQNETEALAGLAVEIIKEMESAMNMALWMSMCWSYAWRRNRQEIYIKLFFPVAIVGLLSVLFSLVLWNLLSKSSTLHAYKYGAPPVCILVLLWTIFVRVYNTVQPVSCKLFSYFNPAQHESNLGYHHQVIADIKFTMNVLRAKPLPTILSFLAKCKWIWLIFGLEDHDYIEGTHIFKQELASDMRIVVLVDDLDRCTDQTILKVLAAINLVLSACEINVILGIDKSMIHKALEKELFHGTNDSSLAQKFLRKIVQLPITLPDPTNKQMGQFITRQMGFVHKSKNGIKLQRQGESLPDVETEDGSDITRQMGFVHKSKNGIKLQRQGESLPDVETEDGSDDEPPDSNGDEELNSIILARYTARESNIMVHLQGFTEHDPRLPREWKRFLNYHRFACNILSKNAATKTYPDWKIELLVWVFVCWQWKDLMDTIIKDWRKLHRSQLEVGSTGEPKEGKIENGDNTFVGGDTDGRGDTEIQEEEGGESSNKITKQKSLESPENNNPHPSLYTISEFFSKLEKRDNEHRHSWKSLLTLLKSYNVSMNGILIFQDFRFNCKHGVLPWPIKDAQETREGSDVHD